MRALLTCRGVSFSLGEKKILRDVNFSLHQGEAVALLGANGAGKSTLLKLLLGSLSPTAGQILLKGKPLKSYSRLNLAKEIAYVPQSHQPHFPYRVEEVLAQGLFPTLGFFGRLSKVYTQQIDHVMKDMAILHLKNRDYTRLSGGERQRVFLARALLQNTPLILLDEPTQGLDYGSQVRLLRLFGALKNKGKTLLAISHDPEQALSFASRVVTLENGQICQDGTPLDIITAPFIDSVFKVKVGQIDLAQGRFFSLSNYEEKP